ncbi:hypothetical protein [Spirosoma luteolum]
MRTAFTVTGLVLLSCLLGSGNALAQTSEPDDDNYQRTTTFGVTTNTNSGILGGLSFRQTRRLPGDLFGLPQARYLSVEVVNVKHPKEIQTTSNFASSRYILGKENYLFAVRGQYGREIALFQRSGDDGMTVNGIVAAGPTLGIIKPYYVNVQEGNRTVSVPYSSLTQAGAIGAPIGPGGFFQGFGQSKFTVGLNVKTALSFELSTFRSNTTGVEIGFLTEIFPQKIVIIPNTGPGSSREDGNRSFFTSGYITLFFGSRK